MASNKWMEDFFGTPKNQKQPISTSQEELQKQKEEKERLSKIKINNNKYFRKLLDSLYIRINVIKYLFEDSVFRGRQTIRFDDLNISDINKLIQTIIIWIDKIGKEFRWKPAKSSDQVEQFKTFICSLYNNETDDELKVVHYFALGDTLIIDLNAILQKEQLAFNTMCSKILNHYELFINLQKNIKNIVWSSAEQLKHIEEMYNKELDTDFETKYDQIYKALESKANFKTNIKPEE